MSKFYLDLEVRSEIPRAFEYSSLDVTRLSGANLGNFVFRYALQSIIEDFFSFTPVNYPAIRSRVSDQEIEEVIVSAANWLGTREQDERSNKVRADIIESVDAPVISFGLGVQAKQGTEVVKLGPESQRLARVLAAKASSLSVRDRLTANTLEKLGIGNVVVTGCPSNFINTQPDLGKVIANKARDLAAKGSDWEAVRTCISEFSGGHAQSGAILKTTLQFMRTAPAFYVAQSPALLPFLLREEDSIPAEYRSNAGMPEAELRKVILAKTLHFSSVDGWLDFCRTCDFAFGMRIHGNMVPMQAGVPSLLVGHDSRTSGLGKEMGVPTLAPSQFIEGLKRGPNWLFEYVAREMERYDEVRRGLARVMYEFLVENRLKVANQFLTLLEPLRSESLIDESRISLEFRIGEQ